jgi:hypothetical protein
MIGSVQRSGQAVISTNCSGNAESLQHHLDDKEDDLTSSTLDLTETSFHQYSRSRNFRSNRSRRNVEPNGNSLLVASTSVASLNNDNDPWVNMFHDVLVEAHEGGAAKVRSDRVNQKLAQAPPCDSRNITYNRKLAVAVEVPLRNNDVNANTTALEYNPANDQVYQEKHKTRQMFYVFFTIVMLLIFIVIGVTVTLVVLKMNQHNNDSATSATATHQIEIDPRAQEIHHFISHQLSINITVLNIENSPENPYARAIHWMIYSDPLRLQSHHPNLIQRFLLVYYYYAVTPSTSTYSSLIQNGWKYCGPVITNGTWYYDDETDQSIGGETSSSTDNISDKSKTSGAGEISRCPPPNLQVSAKTMDDLPIFYKLMVKRWLSQYNECQWMGVHCDSSGQVHSIELGKITICQLPPVQMERHTSSIR